MTAVTVARVTAGHIAHVAANMREADVIEVLALSGRTPMQALEHSIAASDIAYSATLNGVPSCIFGCGSADLLSGVGVPWLLGTSDIDRHYVRFLRGSIYWVDRMKLNYRRLVNRVDDRNEVSKRWLAWLGFSFSPLRVSGNGTPYRVFMMDGGHV